MPVALSILSMPKPPAVFDQDFSTLMSLKLDVFERREDCRVSVLPTVPFLFYPFAISTSFVFFVPEFWISQPGRS